MSEVQCSSSRLVAGRPLQSSVKRIGYATPCLLRYILLYNLSTYSEGGAPPRFSSDLPAPYVIESKLNFSQEEKRETQPFCFTITARACQHGIGSLRWCTRPRGPGGR